MNTQTRTSASDVFTTQFSFFRNVERFVAAFNINKPNQLAMLQKIIPTGNVTFDAFFDAKEYLTLITKVNGTWHTVNHNDNPVMMFFVPSDNAAKIEPTDEEKLAMLKKALPSWLSTTLFGDNLRMACELAAQNQPEVVKTEPDVYCWVAGHGPTTAYAGFVPLSKAMNLSPLHDVNSAIVKNVTATFDIKPYVIVETLGTPKSTDKPTVTTVEQRVKPDLSEVLEKFTDKYPAYVNPSLVGDGEWRESINDWSFTFTSSKGKKVIPWQTLNNDA